MEVTDIVQKQRNGCRLQQEMRGKRRTRVVSWIGAGLFCWVSFGCDGVVGGGDKTKQDGGLDARGDAAGDCAIGGDGVSNEQGSEPPDGALPDGGPPDAALPFTCDPVSTSSPVLDGIVVFDPADPHPGDTVVVVVKSNALGRQEAPPMVLQETHAGGTRSWSTNHMAGGNALYYYAIADVELGDHCLVGKIDGADEISAKFTVTQRPAGPPKCNGGVFKVTENHQWTCAEQPEWGNEIWIYTYDQNGDPMPNVTVRIRWPDTTQRPIHNDTDPPDPSDIPQIVQTGGDGVFHGYNYWPTNQNGYMVFELQVDGCASDVATEITSGWWETDNYGCRHCDPSFTHRNVWGHWSHTIVFELDPVATQACKIPVDHAGQQGCTVEHIHHDPNHTACWEINP